MRNATILRCLKQIEELKFQLKDNKLICRVEFIEEVLKQEQNVNRHKYKQILNAKEINKNDK